MSSRRRRSWRVTAGLDVIAALAENASAFHASLHAGSIAAGYRLTGRSGVWQRKDGTLTVRLVYRHQTEPLSITSVIHGLRASR